MAEHAQRRGTKQRALHALCRVVAQYSAGTAAGHAADLLVICEAVQKILDFLRRVQAAKDCAFAGGEDVGSHPAQVSVNGGNRENRASGPFCAPVTPGTDYTATMPLLFPLILFAAALQPYDIVIRNGHIIDGTG